MARHDDRSATVTLGRGATTVAIDASRGGRISSLVIAGSEFLLSEPDNDDPLSWGMYPMAPYAGRVRGALLSFGGETHALRPNIAPHSIHGTVFDAQWTVTHRDDTSAELECPLGDSWPFPGVARHSVSVGGTGASFTLEVEATGAEMPAQVGWHPWFVPSARLDLEFGAMLTRDPDGIATSERVRAPARGVDDCFVDPLHPPRVTVGGVTIEMISDCPCWVVYDLSPRGVCVEPQSGPPNGVNDSPEVVPVGATLRRRLEVRLVSSRAG